MKEDEQLDLTPMLALGRILLQLRPLSIQDRSLVLAQAFAISNAFGVHQKEDAV